MQRCERRTTVLSLYTSTSFNIFIFTASTGFVSRRCRFLSCRCRFLSCRCRFLGYLVTKKHSHRFLSTKKPVSCFLSDFKASKHQMNSFKSFSYAKYSRIVLLTLINLEKTKPEILILFIYFLLLSSSPGIIGKVYSVWGRGMVRGSS